MTSAGRILVIEDDHAIAEGLLRGLKNAGFSVELARNGRRGAQLLRAQPFWGIGYRFDAPETR